MAKKKKQAAKPAAANARRKPTGKAAKKPAREHNHRGHDHRGHSHDETCDGVEIELDATERKAVDMVLDSEKLSLALEAEAIASLTATVRKFCRQYGAPLSAAQARNVAMVLFGD